MRILFVTHSAFLPEVKRGQERNTDQLCQALQARGHETAVIAGLISSGLVGKWASLRTKFGEHRRAVRDDFAGYPIYRSWDVDYAFDSVLADFVPDIVVVQSWMRTVAHCIEREMPVAYYLHAANEPPEPDSDRLRRETLWLTVSDFAARQNGAHGLSFHIVPPLVDPALYRVAKPQRRHATFIGLQSFKGGERVVELARACPEIPFLIFDNIDRNMPQWPGMSGAELREAAAALPNVTIRPAASGAEAIYGTTKILLAPSRCREAWGRVASEAQINGIPVLASDRGGLPEAVGPGGVCLDYDASIETWTAHLQAMWHDERYYATLSECARTHAARPGFQPAAIIDRFADLLEARAAGIVIPAPRIGRDEIAAEAAESMLA
ncbi:MAG TPA: glycosyltransferase [Stellaceae bacterium]|jgi:glycosyltransferase involved in cell wall biosynthesis|nr:glycosyltransferase [Stellaceae bacterium]